MVLSLLLLRRISSYKPKPYYLFTLSQLKPFSSLSPSNSTPTPTTPTTPPKPSSLSARMSFVFDQIDSIEKERAEKDQTLQRIRAWRESKKPNQAQPRPGTQEPDPVTTFGSSADSGSHESGLEVRENDGVGGGLMSRKVELVHPWPEWIEFMERLVQQNYFDHKRKDEDGMIEDLGFNVADVAEEEGFDFTRDWRTVQTAVLNFGRDRFDIMRSLSRQDLQILVGYGCASTDKKVVFSSKLLRKHVHLDEGDVCSSCNLRSSCERAYLITNKEDEGRTMDVVRVLLTYGFDAIDGSVVNESLMKKKSVKTVVRKLLHEVVKLSAVPIDPNLPPPVIKKPPPKVKQPPPPPRKRVGRDDIEMKKGDWLCPKCDFMNFAKNSVCLQCDANRPKRQLLPGEWECPQCNFLNYRRNVVCFHCECKRPADDYTMTQQQDRQHGPRMQMDKISRRQDVSNAWNFDFDDDESDGADVATFEYADSQKLDKDFPLDRQEQRDTSRGDETGFYKSSRPTKGYEAEYSAPAKPGIGFNDFDDEEDDVDSYELDSNRTHTSSQIDFSDLEVNSDSEDADDTSHAGRRNNSIARDTHSRPRHQKIEFCGSEDAEGDSDTDDDLPNQTKLKSRKVAYSKPSSRNRGAVSFESDDDYGHSSDNDDKDFRSQNHKGNKWGSRRDFGKRSSSYSEDEPFSDSESNGGMSFNRKGQRGGRAGQSGRWDSSAGRGGRIRDKRNSYSEDDLFSDSDSNGGGMSFNRKRQRGGRAGQSGRWDSSAGRGGRIRDKRNSYSEDDLFSDSESNGGMSFNRKGQRGGRAGQNGRWDSSAGRDDRIRDKRNSFTDNFKRTSSRGNSRGRQDSDYNGYKSHEREGSYKQPRGKNSNYGDRSDSYLEDERHSRPRINVR